MKALYLALGVVAVGALCASDVLARSKHDTAKNTISNVRAVADAKVAGPIIGIEKSVADAKVAGPYVKIGDAVVDAKVAGPIIGIDKAVADAKVAGPRVNTIRAASVADAKLAAEARGTDGHIILDLNAPKSAK